jgi:hypothetical protein
MHWAQREPRPSNGFVLATPVIGSEDDERELHPKPSAGLLGFLDNATCLCPDPERARMWQKGRAAPKHDDQTDQPSTGATNQ